MTNEEAIKVLQWALNRLEGHHYITDDYGNIDNSAKTNAFGMAIEALKHRIPKRPTIMEKHYAEETHVEYWCGRCGEEIVRTYEYCPNCGQKQEEI